MSAGQPGPFDAIARKWLALAERRRAHLIELRATGRWRRYLTEQELENQIRELNTIRDRFAAIIGAEPRAAPVLPAGGHAAAPPPPAARKKPPDFGPAIAYALQAAAELQRDAAKSAA